MKWQEYKQKKLENPKFKHEYDELEEEFSELDEKLSAEHFKDKNYSAKFYVRNEKFFEQAANL